MEIKSDKSIIKKEGKTLSRSTEDELMIKKIIETLKYSKTINIQALIEKGQELMEILDARPLINAIAQRVIY